jgi:hypothetical protein
MNSPYIIFNYSLILYSTIPVTAMHLFTLSPPKLQLLSRPLSRPQGNAMFAKLSDKYTNNLLLYSDLLFLPTTLARIFVIKNMIITNMQLLIEN